MKVEITKCDRCRNVIMDRFKYLKIKASIVKGESESVINGNDWLQETLHFCKIICMSEFISQRVDAKERSETE